LCAEKSIYIAMRIKRKGTYFINLSPRFWEIGSNGNFITQKR